MTWPNSIQSNTPSKYQFKLVSDTDSIICNPEPIEWKSGTLEIKRDLQVGGVFSTFQQDSLTFVGNGAEMLRNLFNDKWVNAKCTLIIYRWRQTDRTYIEFPSRFDINFNFYQVVKVGKFHFGVRVKAINSAEQTKLDNRKSVDVDITKINKSGRILTLGGVEVRPYGTSDMLMRKEINYAATNINYTAYMLKDFGDNGLLLDRITGTVSYTSMPLDLQNSEFAETQSVGYQTKVTDINNVTPFFKDALYTYDSLDIFYQIVTVVTQRHIGSFPWTIQIIEVDKLGEILVTTDIGGFGGINQHYGFTDTINISCQKGSSLIFVTRVEGIDNTTAYTELQVLRITQSVAQSPAATTEGFPAYEAIERLSQHIFDTQYPFYSDFFGRTEVDYREGVKYATENELRFAHIQGGINLRGAKLNNTEYSLVLNFDNLFKSLNAIWNVGYSLEKNSALFGDDNVRLRIEEYSHFFQDTEILDLSSRLNKYDIQSQIMPELIPIELKSGFESYEYLSLNGRSEPNTANQRTSTLKTSTKWENISPYRGDTKGVYDNLANPLIQNGSTDTKGDNSVFIIKTVMDSTAWKPETDEHITIINDTSLFKNSLLNRYFTPTMMLLRHGNRIKSGMVKLGTSEILKFQASDKDSSLITSDDGGVTILAENVDVLVSSLAAPIYKPIKHTVNVMFTNSDIETLTANMHGLIRFSDQITGFLLSLKKKNDEDQAEIVIIEKS